MKFALVGANIQHSLSPCIHKLLFQKYGISASYELLEVQSLQGLREGLYNGKYYGYNITIPYKTGFMDCKLSPTAEAIQAVNVLYCKDGTLYGENTDGRGFMAALQYAGFPNTIKRAHILGFGGAARAAGYSLESRGVEVYYFTRRNYLDEKKVFHLDGLASTRADLLVNATPLGMPPNQTILPVDKKILRQYPYIMDMSYSLEETILQHFCKQEEIAFADGLYMLVAQAVFSQEIWLQKKYLLHDDLQYVLENLRRAL